MKKIYNLIIRNSRSVLYISMALTLLPFLLLSFFNHPASDDFCYTNLFHENGFWPAQVKHYLFWTGRFTATFLLTVDPIDINHLTTYKLLPILLFILFGISLFLFIKSLFPKLSKLDRSVLSFLIFFLYLYYIPNTAEAFYWRAGSITYQLASILSLLLFATIRYLQQQQSVSKRVALTILACLLSTTAIGLNETSMIIIMVIVFLWATGWAFIKNEKKIEMAIILFIAIVASITVILAPGNAVRMAEKPEKFQLMFSLVGAIKITLVNILRWFPMTVLLLALFSPIINKVGGLIRTRYYGSSIKLWHLSLFAFFLFCFIVLCFFPSFWSQGGMPPYRTVNVIYLLFVVGMFFLAFLFYAYLQIHNKPVPPIPKELQVFLVFIILGLVMFKPNNLREAYADIVEGTAYRYHLEMKERYRLLENCPQDSCTLPALKNKPITILSSDLSSRPDHESFYYNECIAYHFGIKKVYLPKEETP